MTGDTGDDLTNEERLLFGAHSIVVQLAERCRQLNDAKVSMSDKALDVIIKCLMTELWDQNFSQTEIRSAFMTALHDMDRYAGKERRSS